MKQFAASLKLRFILLKNPNYKTLCEISEKLSGEEKIYSEEEFIEDSCCFSNATVTSATWREDFRCINRSSLAGMRTPPYEKKTQDELYYIL